MSSDNNQNFDHQNDDSQNGDDNGQDMKQEYDYQDDGNAQANDEDQGNDNNSNADNDNDNENVNENEASNDEENGDDNNDDGDGDGDDDDDDKNSNGPKYIRLRGLPWSATHKEILEFLKNVDVIGGPEGIYLITSRWDGKNTGEAYVEVRSQQDVEMAMKLDNGSMGHRYIEVFNAQSKEALEAMRKTTNHGTSFVVKLRGLPYSVTEQQIEEFFNGLEIKPDREGIVFVMDRRGRATGEAFVQFESQEDTEQALGRNREKIGHRYIEIFRSSLAELRRSSGNGNGGGGRMAPYDLKDRGSNRGGSGSDYGGSNSRGRWSNNGGFGVGANNTLGFNNLPNFGNGNFGSGGGGGGGNFGNFGNNGGGGGGGNSNNFGNFGNNGGGGGGGGNFGNFGNGGGNFGSSGGGGGGSGFNRFSGNSGNFGNDFGDFGNFGNNRGSNVGSGGGGGNGFNSFTNFGNCGGNNMGGGNGGFSGNMMGTGGNFGPIGGGRGDEYYIIHMRGLPFSSFENDIFKFFEPLRPANVRVHYNDKNRHNGTAEAMFETYDDAQVAMKCHRNKMGSRYIELFFNGKSSKAGNNYSSGGGNGGSIGMGAGIGSGNFSRRI